MFLLAENLGRYVKRNLMRYHDLLLRVGKFLKIARLTTVNLSGSKKVCVFACFY